MKQIVRQKDSGMDRESAKWRENQKQFIKVKKGGIEKEREK